MSLGRVSGMRALWKIARVVARCSAVAALAAYLASAAKGDNWEIETVDQSGAGKSSSLRIDKSGDAHVVYVTDDGAHSLKYGFWDHRLKQWFVMSVASGASFCSLALDSHQHPHISYADFGTGPGAKLRYAFWDGSAWHTQAIPLNSDVIAYYTSIGLDATDHPSISFYEYRGQVGTEFSVRLRIVTWTGKLWEVKTLDGENQSGKFNSLAIDLQGHIHVAYANVNALTAGMRYAYWDGRSWSLEAFDGRAENSSLLVGYSVCLALDADGNPHVTYMNYSTPIVKYAVRRAGRWEVQAVDRLGGVAYPDRNSIVIDDRGRAYIGYYDSGQGLLKVAHQEGTKWVVEIVDGGSSGFTSSLQLHDGVLWISYADEAGMGLKVARREMHVPECPALRRDGRQREIPGCKEMNGLVYAGRSGPKILSLSCTYPNPLEPYLGVFIRRRLQQLAEMSEVRVAAPFTVVKYGNPRGKRLRIGRGQCPGRRRDGAIEVVHPRWFYIPFGGWLTAFLLFLQVLYPLAHMRKCFPFEVIDTHFGYPDGIAGAFLSMTLQVPFTMTLRGNEPKHARSLIGRWCMGWALRRASRVFTVSERLRQFAIGLGAQADRVRTIPNGVDTSVFFPRERSTCRNKYGLAPDRPVVLSVGALVERKGHHRIIEALRAISAEGAGAQLLIAGGAGPEGDYEATIRQAVSDSGMQQVVRFLGVIDSEKMAEVMTAADVLCLASTNEGWPNVVHEALACGTPVVATDVGAIPDMLPDDRYGLVVPVNDDTALQIALKMAMHKTWDRSVISAWGMARSWRQVAQEVLQEMHDIVPEQTDLS